MKKLIMLRKQEIQKTKKPKTILVEEFDEYDWFQLEILDEDYYNVEEDKAHSRVN